MTVITISESSSRTINRSELDPRVVNSVGQFWKKKLGLSAPALQLMPTSSGDVLRTDQVVGVVRAGDRVVEIFPKFLDESNRESWHSSFLNLVRYAHGHVGHSADEIPAHMVSAASFAEVVGQFFNEELRRAFRRGFPRTYQERFGLSAMPEGALDLARLNSLIVFDGTVPFRSPFLSRQSAISSLIGWAAGRLASLSSTPSLVSELHGWKLRLAVLGNDRPPTNWNRVVVPRSYEYLRPLVEIGQMLASSLLPGVDYSDSMLSFPGFMWRTADIYERAIRRLNAEALSGSGVRVSKKSYPLLSNAGTTIVNTIPDLVFSREGMFVLVGDAKYKNRGSGPETSDAYQVLAAADVTGCSTSVLYYPREGVAVDVKALDVSGYGQARQLAIIDVGLDCFANRKTLDNARATMRQILAGLFDDEEVASAV